MIETFLGNRKMTNPFTVQVLHAKYTVQLLLEVRKLLKRQANIRYASTSLSKQITICGDLHGKLTDLYMIFHKVPHEPRCEKTGLRGFRPGPTQTGLYSHRRWLEA